MLAGALVVLLGLTALLAVPVTVTFHVTWPEVFDNDIRLQWAFGLVRKRFPTGKAAIPPTEDPRGKHITPRPQRSSGKKLNVFAAVWQKGFRQRVIRYIGDLWRAVQKRDVRLHVRLGLGDPADTGQLWAVLGPISGLLANVPDASIRLEPEFQDATVELDSSGFIRLIPLQLVYLTAALFLSPQVWQGLRQMRKGQ